MNINDCEDKYFFEIKDGVIHWNGYFYNTGEPNGWRRADCSRFSTTIKDFAEKYDNDTYCEDFNMDCAEYTNYIYDISDGDIDATVAEELKGVKPINPKDINENTPDGFYIEEARK